jgi:hypothetical protein
MFVSLIVFTLIPSDPLDGLVRGFPSLESARRNKKIARDWLDIAQHSTARAIHLDAMYRFWIWACVEQVKRRSSPIKDRLVMYAGLQKDMTRYEQLFGRKGAVTVPRLPAPIPIYYLLN